MTSLAAKIYFTAGLTCLGFLPAQADRQDCVDLVNELNRSGPRYAETIKQTTGPGLAAIEAVETADVVRTFGDGCLVYDYDVPQVCADLSGTLRRRLADHADKVTEAISRLEANLRNLESAASRHEQVCEAFQAAANRAESQRVTDGYIETFRGWLERLHIAEDGLARASRRLDDVEGRLARPRPFAARTPTDDQVADVFSDLRRSFAGNSGSFGVLSDRTLVRTGLASDVRFDPDTGLFEIAAFAENEGTPGTPYATPDKHTLSGPISQLRLVPVLRFAEVRSETLDWAWLNQHASAPMLILALQPVDQSGTSSSADDASGEPLRIPFASKAQLNSFATDFLKLQAWANRYARAEEMRVEALLARQREAETLADGIKNGRFLSGPLGQFTDTDQETVTLVSQSCAWDRKFKQTTTCRIEHWIVDRENPLKALAVLTQDLRFHERSSRASGEIHFRWFAATALSSLTVSIDGQGNYPFDSCVPGICRSDVSADAGRSLLLSLNRNETGVVTLSGFDEEEISIFRHSFDLTEWSKAVAKQEKLRERLN